LTPRIWSRRTPANRINLHFLSNGGTPDNSGVLIGGIDF